VNIIGKEKQGVRRYLRSLQFIVLLSFSTRVCLRVPSAGGADLALAAGPLAAGVGKPQQKQKLTAKVCFCFWPRKGNLSFCRIILF